MRDNKNGNKKVKKVLSLVILLIIFVPLIWLSFNMIRGEGITFTSLSASVGTRKVFQCIRKNDFQGAANHIGFWGYSADKTEIDPKYIEDEKLRFINGLEDFFSDKGRELISYKDIKFNTDDGYTTGSVELEIKDEEQTYYFTLMLSKQNGKLCPMNISQVTTEEKYADIAHMLVLELEEIMCTHNPG